MFLLGVAKSLDVSLGIDKVDAYNNMHVIKTLEEIRSNLVVQSIASTNVVSSSVPLNNLSDDSLLLDSELQNSKDSGSDEIFSLI